MKGRETFYHRHTVPNTSCCEVKYVLKRVSFGSKDCTKELKLNKIQNNALRIATGAYKSTLVQAMEVECNIMPLSLRREEFALKYWARSSPLGDKLLVNSLVQDFVIYESKRDILRNNIPYAITVQELIKEYNLGTIEIESPIQYDTSGIRSIQPRSELSKVIKKGSTSDSNANKLGNKYIERHYGANLKIYTDGSKDPWMCNSGARARLELRI